MPEYEDPFSDPNRPELPSLSSATGPVESSKSAEVVEEISELKGELVSSSATQDKLQSEIYEQLSTIAVSNVEMLSAIRDLKLYLAGVLGE